jgi:A/G-specific adenine glycosylase
MGQQTQASRIELFLPRFLKRFPTIEVLATAKRSDVIREWQGLGYNRRALNLHRTAIELANEPFPKSRKELLALPGIGDYTANAILIFAYNKKIATVDVNIERLLSRLFRRTADINSILQKKQVLTIAEAILPNKELRLWHEALMDFGATICTKRNPQCGKCPLFGDCKSGKTLIMKSAIESKTKSYKDPLYFGFPKRIWRGRALQLISQNKEITEALIVKILSNSNKKSEFASFIREVLNNLSKDGFCEIIKDKTFRLVN